MKKTLFTAALFLMQTFCSLSSPAADNITVYGINPSGGTVGSWIESFNITVDKTQNPPVTAKELTACPETHKLKAGGGILVVRGSIYYSIHSTNSKVYLNGQNAPLFDAKAVSGYAGFGMGIGDLSGDDTHIWANPWDKSGKVYEFVPNGVGGWKVAANFDLKNAAARYDGMEIFKNDIYANREDVLFSTSGKNPCAKSPNAIYDQYNAANGNLIAGGFIKPTFPASGIAFDGKYFFVSDICNDKIAVYDNTPALIGEADLGPVPGNGIACQAAPKSFCINPEFKRCLEDLSVIVSPMNDADQQSEEDRSSEDRSSRAPQGPVALEITAIPQSVRPGETYSLTVISQRNGVAAPGVPVSFAAVMGDVHFTNGAGSENGQQATVQADAQGRATVQFVTGQPGLSVIEVTSEGSTRTVSISASNIAGPDPQ